jgi:hypothetical protein
LEVKELNNFTPVKKCCCRKDGFSVKQKIQSLPSSHMAWKILSALAAVCLAGSAFFAWKNQERLKNERAREEYTQKNLVSVQPRPSTRVISLRRPWRSKKSNPR